MSAKPGKDRKRSAARASSRARRHSATGSFLPTRARKSCWMERRPDNARRYARFRHSNFAKSRFFRIGPSTVSQFRAQPGLWKITTVALNNGMRLPPQTNSRCLTAEQANDLADTFSPRFGGTNTTCQRTEYTKSEQKLTWRLECRGQFNMDSGAEFTFFSPLRYTAVISTKGWIGDQQIADTQVTLEGEYVGACQ
jgi:hypothetical protein